ncbi:MAG: ABC transporter substrate-binding protein, partial [Candidatus Puniceispirillaceae bacterium]
MNLRKITSFVAVALLATVASTAQANTVKWSMKGDSLTLDPHEQNEGPTTMVSRQIYEALVSRGLDMSIEPQLATGWTIENPTTWVFTLRKGVTFHDGSPLTASDVVFSFNRAKAKTSDFKEYIDSVTSVEAVGADKVKLVTEGPNPILLNQISNIFVMSEAWSKANDSA